MTPTVFLNEMNSYSLQTLGSDAVYLSGIVCTACVAFFFFSLSNPTVGFYFN